MTPHRKIFAAAAAAASRKIFCFSSWITTDLSQISVRRRGPALSCVKTGKCKMKTLHCPDKNKKIVELKQWHHETRSSIWSPAPSHPSGLHGCKKEISVEGKQMGKDIRLSPNWIVSRDTWQIVRTFQLVVVNILTLPELLPIFALREKRRANHHKFLCFYHER